MVAEKEVSTGTVSWKAYVLLLPASAVASVAFYVSQRFFWTDALTSERWQLVPQVPQVASGGCRIRGDHGHSL